MSCDWVEPERWWCCMIWACLTVHLIIVIPSGLMATWKSNLRSQIWSNPTGFAKVSWRHSRSLVPRSLYPLHLALLMPKLAWTVNFDPGKRCLCGGLQLADGEMSCMVSDLGGRNSKAVHWQGFISDNTRTTSCLPLSAAGLEEILDFSLASRIKIIKREKIYVVPVL